MRCSFPSLILALLAVSSSARDNSTAKYPRGYKRSPVSENDIVEVATLSEDDLKAAPAAVDWSAKGATTAVKDQGNCGSCWAFSTVEGIESGIFMSSGKLPAELSTQQVISCDAVSTDDGCYGGDVSTALKYVEQAGGVDTAADYPDKSHASGKSEKCSWDRKKSAKVTSWKYAIKRCNKGTCKGQDEEALAAALAKYGPISICLNAGDKPQDWDEYKGGIYNKTCHSDADWINHCVQLVGYDRSGPEPYWKLRNSWAETWGEKGFIRLPFGKNVCGLADEAYIISAAPVGGEALLV